MNQLISKLYNDEKDAPKLPPGTKMVPVTVRVPEDYLAVLGRMSDRFSKSRASFGGHLLQTAIFEALCALSDIDLQECCDHDPDWLESVAVDIQMKLNAEAEHYFNDEADASF